MGFRSVKQNDWEGARQVLGVGADATEEQVRAAYMAQVRQHPPDRDPEVFERIRDAYELLKDPKARARQVLAGPDPLAPLESILGDDPEKRRFTGPGPWIDVLKEERK